MPYLGYYTIRSKQEYIFRTNVMVEITGASILISEAFDVLFKAADEDGLLRVRRIPKDMEERFSLQETLKAFKNGSCQMAEVFRGGGNDTVLFDSEDSFKLANACFTRRLQKECPGMIPLCVGIEVGNNGVWDYAADWGRLMTAVDSKKNSMTPMDSIAMLPFSMIDRKTFQPVAAVLPDREDREVSAESKAKYDKGQEHNQTEQSNNELDDLVTEKGNESLLAVVHADGNGMGLKIRNRLNCSEEYDFCINQMRDFTEKTARVFAGNGRSAVEQLAQKKQADGSKHAMVRFLICDGDDVTFVCNARYALDYTKEYLKAVQKEQGYSSCAGICIFHSHYPFYMAYDMAEQACDSAKKKMRGDKAESPDESWIDFHYVHSGLNGDLNALRESQHTQKRMARPLSLGRTAANGADSVEMLDRLADLLHRLKVTRGNIKALGAALEADQQLGKNELTRIQYRTPGLEEEMNEITKNRELLLKLFYDLYEIYDLWYRTDGEDEVK